MPFKVRDQIPPVVGKAMDEWTKEDEMLQRGVGEVDIPLDEVFTEILEV